MLGSEASLNGLELSAEAYYRIGSTASLPYLEPDAQMQDVLRILPASSNLAAAAPQASGGAATATDSDTETPMHGLPRVASLDFIRAFLGSKADAGPAAAARLVPAAAAAAAAAVGQDCAAGGALLRPMRPSPQEQLQRQQEQLAGWVKAEPPCSSDSEAPPLAQGQPQPQPQPQQPWQQRQQGSSGDVPQAARQASQGGGLPSAQAHAQARQQMVMAAGGVMGGALVPLSFMPGCAMPGLGAYAGPGLSAAVAASLMPLPLVPNVPGGRADHGMAPSLPSATAGASEGGAAAGSAAERRRAPAAAAAAAAPAPAPPASEAEAEAEAATPRAVISHPEALSKQELRRVRRMISNRESARRSRKRKQEHLGELEGQLHAVQGQLAAASSKAARLAEEVAARDSQILLLCRELESMRQLLLGRR